MKSGTAQKLILNMISTSVMIGLGRVKGNKMVDMQIANNKLVDRAVKIIMKEKKVMEVKIYITQTLVERDMNLKRVLEIRINHL